MALLGWIIALLMVLFLFAIVACDIAFHIQKLPPVGERLRTWALKYPAYAGIAAALLGALLGHFFWQ